MVGTAELIMFAIQSAIRLGGQAKRSYIDSTRARALVLPLPDFDPESNPSIAADYFLEVHPDIERPLPLQRILEKVAAIREGTLHEDLTLKEQEDLVDFHMEALLCSDATWKDKKIKAGETYITRESVNAMLKIRQWEKGTDPNPSPLQRMAGTIFEIGIDYYAHVPGALDKNTRQGKAIHSLLTSLDRVEFADKPLNDLPVRLFVATMETISDNPEIVSKNADFQKLIKVTSVALANDVSARIEQIAARPEGRNQDLEDNVIEWAELVFRSVLSSAGKTVAADPNTYLGVDDDDTSAAVRHVSEAALGFILDQPQGELGTAFGWSGLEVVIKASLEAVGKNPNIILDSNNKGLQKLLAGIATELSKFDSVISAQVLPEVARLILEKTGENLELLWPEMTTRPERHLLLTAASETLGILSKKPDGAKWKPDFTPEDLLNVTETVLDEFAANPGWAFDEAGKVNDNLRTALEATVEVLRSRGDSRLSTKTASNILRSAIMAVSTRQEFLKELPNGKPIVAAAIDVLLEKVFDPGNDEKIAWRLLRSEVVAGLVKASLLALNKCKLSSDKIDKLKDVIEVQLTTINEGNGWDLEKFESDLAAALI